MNINPNTSARLRVDLSFYSNLVPLLGYKIWQMGQINFGVIDGAFEKSILSDPGANKVLSGHEVTGTWSVTQKESNLEAETHRLQLFLVIDKLNVQEYEVAIIDWFRSIAIREPDTAPEDKWLKGRIELNDHRQGIQVEYDPQWTGISLIEGFTNTEVFATVRTNQVVSRFSATGKLIIPGGSNESN